MAKTTINRRRQILWLFLAGLLVLAPGCSTAISRAISRASTPPTPMYFGGVRTDWMVLTESDIWQPQVYGVVDLPFSLVGDVILLPYDIYTDFRHTNDTAATSE